MTHPIPADAERLADRLRALAEEVESAARYGVPIPFMFSVSGSIHGGATFSATGDEFDAWVDYAEAAVEEYELEGAHWRSAAANVNGLPLRFAAKHEHNRRTFPGADEGWCMDSACPAPGPEAAGR